MNLIDIFSLAIEALRKNRLRTLLATLGVVIGISTLMLVLGIAQAAQGLIAEQLASFGSDTIFVEVKVPDTDQATSGSSLVGGVQVKTMKMDDVVKARKLENIKDTYGAVIGQEKVVYKNQSKKSFVFGTNQSYILIDQNEVAEGRFFTDSENDSLARVAVIGQSVKEDLFGTRDALGESIRIKGVSFKVIGVMAKRGAVLFQNYDEFVYLPIKTEQKLILGYDYLTYFVAQVNDGEIMASTAEDVRRFLRNQHHIQGNDLKKDDFSATTSEESLMIISTVFGAVSLLFSGIAVISLIVGGVGIMNIMYVSVTERTREIGLRKSVGARKKQILMQFLMEALVITLLGGVIGVLLGFGLGTIMSIGAGFAGLTFDFHVSLFDLFLIVGVTAAFGLVFGISPAKKAANLQPIDALRME